MDVASQIQSSFLTGGMPFWHDAAVEGITSLHPLSYSSKYHDLPQLMDSLGELHERFKRKPGIEHVVGLDMANLVVSSGSNRGIRINPFFKPLVHTHPANNAGLPSHGDIQTSDIWWHPSAMLFAGLLMESLDSVDEDVTNRGLPIIMRDDPLGMPAIYDDSGMAGRENHEACPLGCCGESYVIAKGRDGHFEGSMYWSYPRSLRYYLGRLPIPVLPRYEIGVVTFVKTSWDDPNDIVFQDTGLLVFLRSRLSFWLPLAEIYDAVSSGHDQLRIRDLRGHKTPDQASEQIVPFKCLPRGREGSVEHRVVTRRLPIAVDSRKLFGMHAPL